jgi:hypothetical protein
MWPAATWVVFALLLFSHFHVLVETNQTLGAFSSHSKEERRCMNASNHILAEILCSTNSILEWEGLNDVIQGTEYAIGKYRVH